MAKHRSPARFLLLTICLLSCTPLLLALHANSTTTSPFSTTSSSSNPSTSLTAIAKGPVLLTKDQLQNLNDDPANVFLRRGSSKLKLDYDDPEAADEARGILWALEWLPELQLRQRIHQVTVEGYGSLTNFTALALGLGQIDRLEELHWFSTSPIPKSIITAVEDSHPDCKLFYNMRHDNWDAYEEGYEPIQVAGDEPHRDVRSATRSMILGSRALHGLTTYVRYGRFPDPQSLRTIHQILTTCPNLRRLDLSIGHQGCVVGPNQPYAFDFASKSDLARAPFAPLESLRLSRYNLDGQLNGNHGRSPPWPDRSQIKWPWRTLPDRILNLVPEPFQSKLEKDYVYVADPPCPTIFNYTTNLDGWIQRMDFSKLQNLDLHSPSSISLHKLAPVLTNLASLDIHGGDKCTAEALEALLINSTVALKHLHLCNVDFSSLDKLIEILASRHGKGLISLDLLESEQSRRHSCNREYHPNCETSPSGYNWGYWYDDHVYLNNSHLQHLQRSSPSIESLDIDLDRNLDQISQTELLETLGSFNNLSSLVLRLESPSVEAIRRGLCRDGRDCKRSTKRVHDPVVNITWVKDTFRTIRSAQTRPPNAPNERPSQLEKFVVIVGRWASQNSRGMARDDDHVVGRFECTAIPVPEGYEMLNGDIEDCTGNLRLHYEQVDQYQSEFGIDDYETDDSDWDIVG